MSRHNAVSFFVSFVYLTNSVDHFFFYGNMALLTGNTAAISFIIHIQYLASISFKSVQEMLRKIGQSSFKCDWFIYNSYQIVFFTHTIWIWYYIICFRFVVGSKKSNDARAEEMNLCNQNIWKTSWGTNSFNTLSWT